MQESRYIVLDEPTNHLDVSYQYQIMDILRNQDVTVFSSIHDLNLALRFCDRFLFLRDGTVFANGGAETVTSEMIRAVYGMNAMVLQYEGIPLVIPCTL